MHKFWTSGMKPASLLLKFSKWHLMLITVLLFKHIYIFYIPIKIWKSIFAQYVNLWIWLLYLWVPTVSHCFQAWFTNFKGFSRSVRTLRAPSLTDKSLPSVSHALSHTYFTLCSWRRKCIQWFSSGQYRAQHRGTGASRWNTTVVLRKLDFFVCFLAFLSFFTGLLAPLLFSYSFS